jgi:glutathione synthase/RimK-type ligase-like ATP-grasp enzyme
VHNALVGLGADVAVLDQRGVLASRIHVDDQTGIDGAVLELPQAGCDRRRVRLGDVTAVYVRTYDAFAIDAVRRAAAPGPAFRHVQRVEGTILSWLDGSDALVINPPEASATNGTKPLQSTVARALGFDVPETLLTTSADAALAFADRHGEVVYKALSGVRTTAHLLDRNDTQRLTRITTGPVQLQRFVRGTNIRVHVLGEQLWACEITGQHVDWRYPEPGAGGAMVPIVLPDAVAERCRSVTAVLGVHLSGIDLIRDHGDRWWFLEANTSPGFTAFPECEHVALAVAQLLGRSSPGSDAHHRPSGACP